MSDGKPTAPAVIVTVPLIGRPRGEERLALLAAAAWWAQQRRVQPLVGVDGRPLAGATWPELMQRAQLAWRTGRVVLDNAVRAGELEALGRAEVPGQRRPLNVYAPLTTPRWASGFESVDAAMAAMCRMHG